MKTLTPFGVQDYLPEEAKARNELLQTIQTIFDNEGFQPISTPAFEYYDKLKTAMGPALCDQCVRFFDPEGRLLVLRPDHTTPIARMVASRLSQSNLPLKWSYSDPIFRKSASQGDTEIFQSGVEIIGDSSPESDAEIISTCIQALQSVGLKNIGIDIGHTAFIDPLTDKQKSALARKDWVEFGSIPERGGKELVTNIPELDALASQLEKDGLSDFVSFNKGLIKDVDYYTGIFFDCYVEGYGQCIGSGGRYDQLISNFGLDAPAVGFALQVNRIEEALRHA
ncbi:hypothetical protein HOH87_05285 [bacterium]|nr:hypothetical protein [bacterium]